MNRSGLAETSVTAGPSNTDRMELENERPRWIGGYGRNYPHHHYARRDRTSFEEASTRLASASFYDYDESLTNSGDHHPTDQSATSQPTDEQNDQDMTVATSFAFPRHTEEIKGVHICLDEAESRRMKERMKTVSVALVLCLNLGVDPPDVVKPNPCAKMECWLEPQSGGGGSSAPKMLERIAAALQKQYERWQPRARYKPGSDPTVEDVKRLCISLRKNAKDDGRVLFHYNGHGVPRPTENGEIWVFNKNYTQYIPLSIYDLQSWMQSPSVYVWDCNCAGLVIKSFDKFAADHEREWRASLEYHKAHSPNISAKGSLSVTDFNSLEEEAIYYGFEQKPPNFKECIHVGACSASELLPMQAEVPADLFTSALTTPIRTAILIHIVQHRLTDRFPLPDTVDKIPGQLGDRRTLLGELNWIFTAITDTIAWNTLPTDLFQKLFRQDLLVASLFRNFLLAERVMRLYGCEPVSSPALPSTHEHPLWDSWDYALDLCMGQLLVTKVDKPPPQFGKTTVITLLSDNSYTHAPFFVNQLTAFEVWLRYGCRNRDPPQQLPVVLQVLLSQVHRVRALDLLSRFLDLGSWAVSLALSVGIFPYVLKLLQSAVKDLRPYLSFIWAKILAVDPGCRSDLVKDGGHMYFLNMLIDQNLDAQKKIVPAFVCASLTDANFRVGQEALMDANYITTICDLLQEPTLNTRKLLMLWLTLGIGGLWREYDAARWAAVRLNAGEVLADLLTTPPWPEVRAAAVYSLGTLLTNRACDNPHALQVEQALCQRLAVEAGNDSSPLVRQELAVALHWFVLDCLADFVALANRLHKDIHRQRIAHAAKNGFTKPPSMTPLTASSSSSSFVDIDHRNQPNNDPSTPLRRIFTTAASSPHHPPTETGGSASDLTAYGRNAQSFQEIEMDIADQLAVITLGQTPFQPGTVGGTIGNVFSTVWLTLLRLATDPHPLVSELASVVVVHVNSAAARERRRKAEAEKSLRRRTSAPNSKQNASSDDEGSYRPTFTVGSPPIVMQTSAADGAVSVVSPMTKPKSPNKQTSSESKPKDASRTGRSVVKEVSLEEDVRRFRGTGHKDARALITIEEPPSEQIPPTATPDGDPRTPLVQTEFAQWCTKAFSEPVLDTAALQQPHEAGIVLLDDREDRYRSKEVSDWAQQFLYGLKNDLSRDFASLKGNQCRLETQRFHGLTSRPPNALCFYSLKPYLCASDGYNISIWNWEDRGGHRLATFPNLDQRRSRFDIGLGFSTTTHLDIVNPLTSELLLTGTNDGLVKLWRVDLDGTERQLQTNCTLIGHKRRTLVTAFRLLNDQTRLNEVPMTVYHWEQDKGVLLAAGDCRVVRVWDSEREQAVRDLPLCGSGSHSAGASTSVVQGAAGGNVGTTALSGDLTHTRLIAAGCDDGTVRLFDGRLPASGSRVTTLRGHRGGACVVGVQLRRGTLVAGSADGHVRVWEPRMFQEPIGAFCVASAGKTDANTMLSTSTIASPHYLTGGGGDGSSVVRAMTVSEGASMVAVSVHDPSSNTYAVRIRDFNGNKLGTIRYHLLGQKIGEVNCVRFHPYRTLLAAGTVDSVSAYGTNY